MNTPQLKGKRSIEVIGYLLFIINLPIRHTQTEQEIDRSVKDQELVSAKPRNIHEILLTLIQHISNLKKPLL
jgi:hypothetical protein